MPLLEEAGRKLGEETKLKGAHCLLSPAINMQRGPVGGRGFESIGEDPVLAGLGAAALCRGIERAPAFCRRRSTGSATTRNMAVTQCCPSSPSAPYYGTYSTNDAINAGLDLEMPGPSRFRGDLLKPWRWASPRTPPETTGDTPETAELLRRIGGETLVLLKNDNDVLPLKKDKKTVVIGPNAKIATYQGGGSAAVPAYYAVTPFDGISQKLESPPSYAAGAYAHKLLPLLGNVVKTASGEQGMTMKAYTQPPGRREPRRRSTTASYQGPAVVNQSGMPVTMPWLDDMAGLVQAWYGGNETGNVIADVLFGDVNPSGKLPVTFPRRLQDNAAFLDFCAESSRILYGEGIYIGYRHYEFADRAVLFPFGHGLSYTSFSFSDVSVTAATDGKLIVEVTVKNTGAVRGAEVVQVYVAPGQKARVKRPVKELKGERVTVEAQIKYAAAYWDETRHQWCVEASEYDVIVSDSSAVSDKAVRGLFKVDETYWWIGL
ncbi:glycosyl hydrolase family 3 C-terminal domain-containing protein [Ilyonectria sp. MPI-CAGE-AT-0026]|nr:glycosyl hydrolase family 3 C-terminal domain-containing protein [Ilyonectria sp. MPI-CAGE-AT-0026]